MPNQFISALKENKDGIRKKVAIVGGVLLGIIAVAYKANQIANDKSDEIDVLVLHEVTNEAPISSEI